MSDPSAYPQDEGPFQADWDGLAEEDGSGDADDAQPAERVSEEEERVDPPGSARRGRI